MDYNGWSTLRAEQNATPATPATGRGSRKAHYLPQRSSKSKSHKMPREGHKLMLWKSVEKTPILQPINYQAIIKSVEMVEKKISTA